VYVLQELAYIDYIVMYYINLYLMQKIYAPFPLLYEYYEVSI
jgi:hypothetical protein